MSSHRNHVLDGGAHWRHLANTIERSVRGGDAVLCQNVLSACSHYWAYRSLYVTVMYFQVV